MTDKRVGRDFCHVMQDTMYLYLGAKLTYGDMLDMDESPFKWRVLIGSYILKETTPETTLEQHLLTLRADGLSYMAFRQLKMKICFSVRNREAQSGKRRKEYTSETCGVEEFVSRRRQEQTEENLFIEEVKISKFALMTMSV